VLWRTGTEPVPVPLIERYRERLPVDGSTPIVSLGEGSTPLLRAERLSERYGAEIWLKCEGLNPTGSFKDRGMTLAVSKALEEEATTVVCASTGNTAASAAAYAARAGLRSVIVFPAGAVALGKLAQARAVGAELREIDGSFDESLETARGLAAQPGCVLVNSLNPYRVQGQKTAAFEIVEDLGRAPDVLALPYGGGGNTHAYALGFAELLASPVPRLVAVEAADRHGTVASAIRIGQPVHGDEVEEDARLFGGQVVALPDDEILRARAELGELEGVFCEPASAAGLAAVARERPGGVVVCVITGHGLKDPGA
jgi:threonine synthase